MYLQDCMPEWQRRPRGSSHRLYRGDSRGDNTARTQSVVAYGSRVQTSVHVSDCIRQTSLHLTDTDCLTLHTEHIVSLHRVK